MEKLDAAHTQKTTRALEDPIRFITKIAILLLLFAVLFSIVLLILETNFFRSKVTYDLPKIGAWGDTIGGILNPLFSFLALMGLLWTIRLQSKELGLSRNELELTRTELEGSRKATEEMVAAAEQQNIENAFFQLFNLFQENLQTIKTSSTFPSENLEFAGATAFEKFAQEIQSSISMWASEIPEEELHIGDPDQQRPNGWKEILKLHSDSASAKKELLLRAYSYTYNTHQAHLGRYFRLLYNLLRFLNEKEKKIPKEMYETYFKIVRASLSNYELFLIMVNCLTKVGQPMRKYVSQFELFDNLPENIFSISVKNSYHNYTDNLDITELWLEFDSKSFGSNPHFHKLK